MAWSNEVSDPAQEERELQPERDGRVRCGAWLLGGVVMAMLPMRKKAEARQCPKNNGGANRPPKIFAVKTSGGEWNNHRDAHCHIHRPRGKCGTKTSQHCCDDG